jgi:hypothetical protein
MLFGIEVHFQFRILGHPNSRYSKLPMPIPNSETQYLHPNAVLLTLHKYLLLGAISAFVVFV